MNLLSKRASAGIIGFTFLAATSGIYANQTDSRNAHHSADSKSISAQKEHQPLKFTTFKDVYMNFGSKNAQLMTKVHRGDTNKAIPLAKALQQAKKDHYDNQNPTVILKGLTGTGTQAEWFSGNSSNDRMNSTAKVKKAIHNLGEHDVDYILSSGGPQVRDKIALNPIWAPYKPDDTPNDQQHYNKPKLEKVAEQYQHNGHLKGFDFRFDYHIYESLYRAKATMEQVVKMEQWRFEHGKPLLRISVSLPVRGTKYQTLTSFDIDVLKQIVKGVNHANSYVADKKHAFQMKDLHLNLLASNYRNGSCVKNDDQSCNMSKSAIAAIKGAEDRVSNQIPQQNISITPMIGYNTTLDRNKNSDEFLSKDDMQQIVKYAQANHLSGVHFIYTRDKACANSDHKNHKNNGFPDRCNGTNYNPLSYYNTVVKQLNS